MRTLAIAVTLMTFWDNANAECIGQTESYLQMTVVSCVAATNKAASAIEGKGYSESEAAKVQSSAKFISIVEANAISDVEIVKWNSRGQQTLFKGQVTPYDPNVTKQFMMLGVSEDDCKKFYEKRPILYSVVENFRCCRDVIMTGRKETTAQCLLKMSTAARFGPELKNLSEIGFDRPSLSVPKQ